MYCLKKRIGEPFSNYYLEHNRVSAVIAVSLGGLGNTGEGEGHLQRSWREGEAGEWQ